MKEYYTYAYLRQDGTPYYIGKGKGDRAYSKNRAIKPPKNEKILFLKQNLTEEEAFGHEKYMIAVLGRKDLGTGILRNRTDGGEGVSGMKHTDESKKKIGKAFRGKKLTQEHVEKVRKAQKGRVSPLRGSTISQEQREKIRKTMLGVKHTAKRRKNQSLAKIGVKHTAERCAKKSALQTGKHWYNNGKINRFDYECPDGFVPGMIKGRQRD